MPSGVFSPLAHGYGTWTGQLDFPELRELEAATPTGLPLLVDPHTCHSQPPSHDVSDSSLHPQSNTSFLLTPREHTPGTSTPRQGQRLPGHGGKLMRAQKGQKHMSLPGSAVYPRGRPGTSPRPNTAAAPGSARSKPRAMSATPTATTTHPQRAASSSSHHTPRPPTSHHHHHMIHPDTGQLAMPKTFVTRRGALVLFSAPADLDLNRLTEQERAYLNHASKLLKDRYTEYSDKFGSIQRLAHSVLTFGDQEAATTDTESITDPNHQVWLKFLRDASDMDTLAQPGGDVKAYLRSLRFKPGSAQLNQSGMLESFRLSDIRRELGEKLDESSMNVGDSSFTSQRGSRKKKKMISAEELASSLKSASYLGRPCPTPLTTSAGEYTPQYIPYPTYSFPGVDVSENGRPAQMSFFSDLSTQSLLLNETNTSLVGERGEGGEAVTKATHSRQAFDETEEEFDVADESEELTQGGRRDTRSVAPEDITGTLEEAAGILSAVRNHSTEELELDVTIPHELEEEDGFEQELLFDRDEEEEETEGGVAQPLMPSYGESLVQPLTGAAGGPGATFSLQSSSADNIAVEDVKIEDLSHKLLDHGSLDRTQDHMDPSMDQLEGQMAGVEDDVDNARSQRSASVNSSVSGLADEAYAPSMKNDSVQKTPSAHDSAHKSVHDDSIQKSNDASMNKTADEDSPPDEVPPTLNDSAHKTLDSALQAPPSVADNQSGAAIASPRGHSSPKLTSTPKSQSLQGTPLRSPSLVDISATAGAQNQSRGNDSANQNQPPPEKELLTEAVPARSVSALSSIRGDSVTVTPQGSRFGSPLPTPLARSRPASSKPQAISEEEPKEDAKSEDVNAEVSKEPEEGVSEKPIKTVNFEVKPKAAKSEEKTKDVPKTEKKKEKPDKTKDAKKEPKTSAKPAKEKEPKEKSKAYTKVFDITSYEEPVKQADPPRLEKADFAAILGVPSPPPQEKKKDAPRPRLPRVRKKSMPPPKTKDEIELEKLEKEMNEMFDGKKHAVADETLEEGEEGGSDVGMTAEELELEAQILKEKLAAAEQKIQKEPEETKKKTKKEKPEKGKKGKKGKKKAEPEDESELEKKKEAIREAKRLEKEKRLEEARLLEARIREKDEERQHAIEEAQRKKRALDAELREMQDEAQEANQAEEEARNALVAARKLAREEREAKRKADIERKKQETINRRAEEKARADAARQRELDMLMRISDAEEKRALAEAERKRKEEEEEKELDRQQEEERLAKQRAEEDEERIREAERQGEEEAMARLVEEREEAERKKRKKMDEARKLAEEEEKMREKLLAEEKRLDEEKKKQEEELRRRQEEEQKRMAELRRLEAEAREKLREEMEKRREVLLKRRDHNLERRNHSDGLRVRQCIQRPWVWTYYVLWPRETYEKKIGGEDDKKKKGFRPKPKPKAKK